MTNPSPLPETLTAARDDDELVLELQVHDAP